MAASPDRRGEERAHDEAAREEGQGFGMALEEIRQGDTRRRVLLKREGRVCRGN
jgi:hypothetical protein